MIERIVGTIDERLSYREFLQLSRRQAENMALEIVEDGITYRATDIKTKIEGNLNVVIAIYTKVLA